MSGVRFWTTGASFLLMMIFPCFSQSTVILENRPFEPEGKFFSIRLPSGWERSEMDQMKDFNQYSLKVYAPGFEGLGYLLIGVDYYSDPFRSPERFIYDLQHPGFSGEPDASAEKMDIQVAGKQSVSLTMKDVRTLIGMDDRIPCERRYVVCPAETGFFVLSYDTPAAQFQKYLPYFDAVLSTFRAQVAGNKYLAINADESSSMPEISSLDYEVYTDFLRAGKLLVKETPPYFEEVFQEYSVLDRTSLNTTLDKQSSSQIIEAFGPSASGLVNDLKNNNVREYLVKDKIYIPMLRILPQKSISLSRGLSENSLAGRSSYLAFSRVGFNADKTLAFLYVGHAGNPITSYFVLMAKEDGRWVIKNVSMDKMLIR